MLVEEKIKHNNSNKLAEGNFNFSFGKCYEKAKSETKQPTATLLAIFLIKVQNKIWANSLVGDLLNLKIIKLFF